MSDVSRSRGAEDTSTTAEPLSSQTNTSSQPGTASGQSRVTVASSWLKLFAILCWGSVSSHSCQFLIKIIRQTLMRVSLRSILPVPDQNIRQTLLRVSLGSLLPVPDKNYPPDFAAGHSKVTFASSWYKLSARLCTGQSQATLATEVPDQNILHIMLRVSLESLLPVPDQNIRQTLLRVSLESLLPVPEKKYQPDIAGGQSWVAITIVPGDRCPPDIASGEP